MKSSCRAPSACLELDYVRDTLFGPLSQRVEYEVQLAPLQLGGRQGLQLHIAPPLPKKLDRSHSLAFVWEGKAYHGVVRHHGKCGDGGIKLLLELQ